MNPLIIKPEGEIEEWEFGTGHYCGKAEDSIGVRRGRFGSVLTREDAIRLRDWLTEATTTWHTPPRKLSLSHLTAVLMDALK